MTSNKADFKNVSLRNYLVHVTVKYMKMQLSVLELHLDIFPTPKGVNPNKIHNQTSSEDMSEEVMLSLAHTASFNSDTFEFHTPPHTAE